MIKVKVNGKQFSGFANYQIDLKFNSVASAFSLGVKQDIVKSMFDYPDCVITSEKNGLLITGTIMAPSLKSSSKPESTQIAGYSKCGILEDCSIPISLYPLQYDNLSLGQITAKILNEFGLSFVSSPSVADEMNKTYEKTTSQPGETIKDFLNKLASQRGVILSNDRKGQLLYTRFAVNELKPVASFAVGRYGVSAMDLNINSQAMHSDITVMGQASDNPDASEFTIKNPYVSKFRPIIKKLDSGDNFDAEKAARFELANEISNIKLTFNTTKFIYPGQLITVENSEINLTKPTEFFVQETSIKGTEKDEEHYTLTCVPKDVYTNSEAKNIFL